MRIRCDCLKYDTEVLLMVYGGHRQIFAMPSRYGGCCNVFISRDLIGFGLLDTLPKRRGLTYLGVSPANRQFIVYGCTWGDPVTALRALSQQASAIAKLPEPVSER